MLKSKFSKIILSLSLLLAPLFAAIPLLSVSAANPDDICNLPNVSPEVQAAAGCSTATLPELKDVITSIVNGIIAVVGFVAVCFVVYGGIQYITSSGDSSKTTKARNTIFYALIGLAICALSFLIVNFVIVNLISGNGAGKVTGDGAGVETVGDGNNNLVNAITTIVNGVIYVLGFVCVIFILYGGLQYMTSSGDTQKIEKAKKTIIFAAIGLAICVLSFAITNFVIRNIINGPKTSYITTPESQIALELPKK